MEMADVGDIETGDDSMSKLDVSARLLGLPVPACRLHV